MPVELKFVRSMDFGPLITYFIKLHVEKHKTTTTTTHSVREYTCGEGVGGVFKKEGSREV